MPHVALDEDALLDGLGHAHHVDWLASLVRGDADHGLNGKILFRDGAHDILRAHDVRLHRFVWRVFARGYLLHRRSIDHDVHVAQCRYHARVITDVADAELQFLLEVAIDD